MSGKVPLRNWDIREETKTQAGDREHSKVKAELSQEEKGLGTNSGDGQ